MIELNEATLDDFDDYYAIRCGKSDIYWMGYEKAPDRDLMYKSFKGKVGNHIEALGQPGGQPDHLYD